MNAFGEADGISRTMAVPVLVCRAVPSYFSGQAFKSVKLLILILIKPNLKEI